MLFPTITFAAFFMAVWPASWLVAGSARARQLVLLVASGVFYAYWDVRFLALIGTTILVSHTAARVISGAASPRVQRAALFVGVSLHLGILGWFKYAGFFASSLTSAAGRVGVHLDLPLIQVVLPLGVSFFTFEAISYLVEVRREVVTPGSLLEVATWLSFFPTIASGPITRPSELFHQLRNRPQPLVETNRAFGLIVRGLFKKMVVASFLASNIADSVFANPQQHSGAEVLAGIYAYAVQLYMDFSGYADMAIGLALLLGIELPENFNSPYRAASVTEFWTRWHMTLSRWLRDFVFNPLALRSRRTTAATCRTLIIVMLLAGLWHGAAWTFVVFGGIHGVAMATERWARQRGRQQGRTRSEGTLRVLAHRVLTFHVVCLGWVFFRADSISTAGRVLGRLTTAWTPAPLVTPLVVACVLAAVAAHQLPRPTLDRVATLTSQFALPVSVVVGAVALVVIDLLGPAGVPPFVYFGF